MRKTEKNYGKTSRELLSIMMNRYSWSDESEEWPQGGTRSCSGLWTMPEKEAVINFDSPTVIIPANGFSDKYNGLTFECF